MRKSFSIIVIVILGVVLISTKAIAMVGLSENNLGGIYPLNTGINCNSDIKVNTFALHREAVKNLYQGSLCDKTSKDDDKNLKIIYSLPASWMVDANKFKDAKQEAKVFSLNNSIARNTITFKPEFSGSGLCVIRFSLSGIFIDLSFYKTLVPDEDKNKTAAIQPLESWNVDSLMNFAKNNLNGEARAIVNILRW